MGDRPDLAPLVENPLLLTAVCILYDNGGRLPEDRYELYRSMVNVVLHSRYPVGSASSPRGAVAGADEGDDWADPGVWARANPNLGRSVKEDDLRRKAEKALALPGAQNAFRRMHLNEWTEQAERWIDMGVWDACDLPVDPEDLRGRRCFGGLDLSTLVPLVIPRPGRQATELEAKAVTFGQRRYIVCRNLAASTSPEMR